MYFRLFQSFLEKIRRNEVLYFHSGFSVSINGNSSKLDLIEQELKLPQNQTTFAVVCDPSRTEYCYSWFYESGGRWGRLLCSDSAYTTKCLPEGFHKFKVIVAYDEKTIEKLISVNVSSGKLSCSTHLW